MPFCDEQTVNVDYGTLPYRDTRELPVAIWRMPIYYVLNSLERVNRFWWYRRMKPLADTTSDLERTLIYRCSTISSQRKLKRFACKTPLYIFCIFSISRHILRFFDFDVLSFFDILSSMFLSHIAWNGTTKVLFTIYYCVGIKFVFITWKYIARNNNGILY